MWEICHYLVEKSAYWYGHRSGSPVHAPKYAERMVKGQYGWEIDFGANYFLVELALRRVWKRIFDSGGKPDPTDIRDCILGAVANYAHEEYPTYWDLTDGFMVFGTQGINVIEFLNALSDKLQEDAQ